MLLALEPTSPFPGWTGLGAQAASPAEPQQASPVVDEDAGLVARAKAGELKASEALYRKHVGSVHAVVHRMLRGAPEVEDLVQDVFVRAFRGLPNFKGGARFRTWLLQIATNACLNHLAKAERKYHHESLDAPVGEGELGLGERLDSKAPSPEELYERGELGARVEAALAQLKPEFRAVVVLRDVQDLPYEEVASTLGIQLGTVKSRLARARRQIQQWLGDWG